jgi:Protein of unknown function (DUF4235)
VKLLYLPFGILAGILGARAGKRTFQAIWPGWAGPISKPGEPDANFAHVVLGAAVQGATLAGVTAAVKLVFARVFHHLIGGWPDKPTGDPA